MTARIPRLVQALLCAQLLASTPGRADTFQTWYQHSVMFRLGERWSVGNNLDLRVTDAVGELATTLISPRIRYDLDPHWALQLNGTWVDAQSAGGQGRTESLRLEVELNPRYALTGQLTFSARNRFEGRFIEDEPGVNPRLRIRPQFDFATPWAGPVHAVFTNNEVFYDFDRDRVTENRFVPFGVVFNPGPHAELRVYHLWRRTLAGEKWFDFHVLGLQLNSAF